jgi:hypothetical protein
MKSSLLPHKSTDKPKGNLAAIFEIVFEHVAASYWRQLAILLVGSLHPQGHFGSVSDGAVWSWRLILQAGERTKQRSRSP